MYMRVRERKMWMWAVCGGYCNQGGVSAGRAILDVEGLNKDTNKIL